MENSNMTAKKERKDRTVLFACLGAVAAGMILAVLTFLVMFSIDLAGGVEDIEREELYRNIENILIICKLLHVLIEQAP